MIDLSGLPRDVALKIETHLTPISKGAKQNHSKILALRPASHFRKPYSSLKKITGAFDMNMRRPAPFTQLYAWHRAALAGGDTSNIGDSFQHGVECGWSKMQQVKKGPWVPVKVWCQREINPETGELENDEFFRCEINGLEVDLNDPEIQWRLLFITPISRQEFYQLFTMQTTHPAMAATAVPIDLTEEAMRP